MTTNPLHHIIQNHIDPRMPARFVWAIAEYIERNMK